MFSFLNRCSRNAVARRRARRQFLAVPALESLEDRVLLSNIAMFDGVLIVNGSNAAETLVVYHSHQDAMVQARVYAGNQLTSSFSVATADVRAISIRGFGGNDHAVNQTSFSDFLRGGTGDDRLTGGHGESIIFGQAGDDTLRGREGRGIVSGGTGNDVLVGGLQDDRLSGEGGNDLLLGLTGNDFLLGGNHNDRAFGGAGDDRIAGQAGRDLLRGEDQNDELRGGLGEDDLKGQGGNDRLVAVGDFDFEIGKEYLVEHVEMTPFDSSRVFERNSHSGIESAYLVGGAGDNLMATYNTDPWSSLIVYPFEGAVTFLGLGGNDRLLGGIGSDVLVGGAGGDFIQGGLNNDLMVGGPGNDGISVGMGDDRVEGGAGTDTIWAWWETSSSEGVHYILTDDSLTGQGIDSIAGIEEADLSGDDGDDVIDVSEFSGPVKLSGRRGNDTLIGTEADDELFGGGGNDTIRGGAGNDTIHGDDEFASDVGGDDTIYGGIGDDNMYGDDGNSTNNNISDGDDTMFGEDGNDTMFGEGGVDTLTGGDGADTLDAGGQPGDQEIQDF